MTDKREGQRVPEVTFRTRQNNEWAEVSSKDVFAGKTAVVFALPGAFTPTCSASHVPRFNELAPVFRENSVDDIVCISVNDAFVMNAWQADQGAWDITFLPDGNGEFTEGMGMLVDKGDLGFGKRSWRYAMVVRDGVVEKMFVEPDVPGDPYEVSDADTVLGYLNPEAKQPEKVSLFTKPGCPYCARAKKALEDHGVAYEELEVDQGVSMATVRAVSGVDTVPQAFVNGERIGGSEAIAAWAEKRRAA
ncbi:glutathione peroxidase [Thiohalorhabdus denitrificans]|uniref:Glutaredoxin-family domain-containing protein n=1 Tax=Thiohalorhabdus denitrificans TaxID=381306 RepID=A0A0P9EGA9_9GAMM|nr:glutathione peroxidase [Thiohalorhabdus denitrificans]KPV41559.1 glutathione peroxidase [Thiohalorhabdus denitrificans]SCY22277.1 Glutaredoxin-family domain-containing protein [Thiohalorhabdus denitrificans]